LLWLKFDATRMVAQSRDDHAAPAPDGPRLPAPPSQDVRRPGDITG